MNTTRLSLTVLTLFFTTLLHSHAATDSKNGVSVKSVLETTKEYFKWENSNNYKVSVTYDYVYLKKSDGSNVTVKDQKTTIDGLGTTNSDTAQISERRLMSITITKVKDISTGP